MTRLLDFGAHHRLSKAPGLVHASNTMRAGPSKVRVTTSSRSDFRSTVVGFFMGVGSLSLLFASIDLLLPFPVQGQPCPTSSKACLPELAAYLLDPRRLFLQSAQAGKPCRSPHAPDLLRGDEPRPPCSKTPTCASFMPVGVIWNFSARSVIEASARPSCSRTPRRVASESAAKEALRRALRILNHAVQHVTQGLAACKWRPSARCVTGRLHRTAPDASAVAPSVTVHAAS